MKTVLIENENDIYICMHYEQVIHNLFLDTFIREDAANNRAKGIYQRTLNQTAMTLIYEDLVDENNKKIYFDMSYIRKISDNEYYVLNSLVKRLCEADNSIVFCSVCNEIFGIISDIVNDNRKRKYSVYIANDENEHIVKRWETIIDGYIKEEVIKCTVDYNRESPSSRVILNKYINVKKMIENWSFFCFAVYRLALKLCDEGLFDIFEPEKNADKCLLVHTINGSTIGVLLGQMFAVDICKVDHLGPKNRGFNMELSNHLDSGREYYTVSDVICLGREISDVKTLIMSSESKYKGSITFINIETVGTTDNNIHYLINVDKSDNFIDYHIRSEL